MSVNLRLYGGALIALATVFFFMAGVRALRNSRRLISYQLRLPYIALARRSFAFSGLLASVLILLILSNPISIPKFASPFKSQGLTETYSITPTQTLTISKKDTPTQPLFILPAVTSGTANPRTTLTSTPSIPEPILAQFQSVITPQTGSQISRLRFATEMHGNQLIGPSVRFRNPIRRMFIVYSYAHMTPGVQWTLIWYRDGEYLGYETRTWNADSSGAGIIEFEQEVDQWLPGIYEIRLFVGDEWKASGSFSLSGVPPTLTLTNTITPTASVTPIIKPTMSLTPRPPRSFTSTPIQ